MFTDKIPHQMKPVVFIILQMFFATRAVWKIDGEYHLDISQFYLGIFSNGMHLPYLTYELNCSKQVKIYSKAKYQNILQEICYLTAIVKKIISQRERVWQSCMHMLTCQTGTNNQLYNIPVFL